MRTEAAFAYYQSLLLTPPPTPSKDSSATITGSASATTTFSATNVNQDAGKNAGQAKRGMSVEERAKKVAFVALSAGSMNVSVGR